MSSPASDVLRFIFNDGLLLDQETPSVHRRYTLVESHLYWSFGQICFLCSKKTNSENKNKNHDN